MTANQTTILNIGFREQGKIYQAFTLRPSPNELFMHLCYSSEKRKFKDLDAEVMTRRPDHFSWHADGKGHLKLGPNHKLQKGNFTDGTFLPSGKADFSPLFILSYMKGEETWEAKYVETDNSLSHLLDVGSLDRFSILGFLIPSNMPLAAFQHLYACFTPKNKTPVEIALSNLFFTPINPLRFAVYPGYDILIFVSDLINLDAQSIEKLQQQLDGGAHFSAIFVDIDKALPKMLYQRILAS